MTSPILFAGQEDLSFTPIGVAYASSLTTGSWGVDTTAGHFRSGYGRYALTYQALNVTTNGLAFLRSGVAFASSNFWTSTRLYNSTGSNSANTNSFMRWADAGGVVRLIIRSTSGQTPPTGTWQVCSVNAAGTVTQLGSNVAVAFGNSNPAGPDKIDVFINYAVAGQFTVYINGVQVYTFTGDVTTDSVTSLAFVDLGQVSSSSNSATVVTGWSECVVATRDTRNMSLVTQAATALGNTHTFTGGAVANINLNRYTDVAPDFSTTAAQIQEYQITPATPTGNFSVVSVVQHGRVTLGASGPTHIDFMVRTGAADFVSSDLAPTGAWSLLTNNWDLNPNTSAAWQTSELPASSTSFNFGYKSVV